MDLKAVQSIFQLQLRSSWQLLYSDQRPPGCGQLTFKKISPCPQPSGNRPAKTQGSRRPKTSPSPGSLGLVLPPGGLKYTMETSCEGNGPWEDQTRNLSRLSLWIPNSFLIKMVWFFRAIPRLIVARQIQDPALYYRYCPAGTHRREQTALYVCPPGSK